MLNTISAIAAATNTAVVMILASIPYFPPFNILSLVSDRTHIKYGSIDLIIAAQIEPQDAVQDIVPYRMQAAGRPDAFETDSKKREDDRYQDKVDNCRYCNGRSTEVHVPDVRNGK